MHSQENPSYLSVVKLYERYSVVMLSWVATEDTYMVVKTSRRRHETKEQAMKEAEQWAATSSMEVRL